MVVLLLFFLTAQNVRFKFFNFRKCSASFAMKNLSLAKFDKSSFLGSKKNFFWFAKTVLIVIVP